MDNLYRYRNWLFLFVAILLVITTIPMVKLKIDNSVGVWFYKQDSALIDYRANLDAFDSWDYLVLAIHTDSSIYTPAYLKSLRQVGDKIEKLDNIVKVTSITNAKDNIQQDDGLAYLRMLDEEINEDSISRLKRLLNNNSVYSGGLISSNNATTDSNKTSLILIQVANIYGNQEPYRIQLLEQVHKIMTAASAFSRYDVVGTPNMNAELNISSKRDMFVFYPLVSLLVTIFAWLVFRSVKDIAITFSVVITAIVLSVGSMMGLGYKLNMVTIMMGAILMSLSVASVVHLISTYHLIRKDQKHCNPIEAAKQTINELWVPCLGATITTMLGFLSLSATNIVPITLLGVFSALGIMLAFIFTLTLGAVLLPYLWADKFNTIFSENTPGLVQRGFSLSQESLLNISLKHKHIVIFGFIIVAAVLLSGLKNLQADSNYLQMFKSNTRVADAYGSIAQSGFGSSSITIHIDAKDSFASEDTFRGVMALEKRLLQLDRVRKVIGPVSIITEVDKAFAEDSAQWQEGFEGYNREAFAQLILIAESSGNDDLSDFLTMDHQTAQIAVMTDYLSGKETNQLKAQIEDLISQTIPNSATARVVGVPVMWANMDKYLFKSQATSLAFLSAAIFFVLLIFLRSFPLAIIGLLVNLLPIAMILGLMGHLGVNINIATILIGGIAMGIAVDDTIHFLWRYKAELAKGATHHSAIQNTLQFTGLALVLTSLLLIGGFSVMMLSDFVPTADFGLYTSLTVVLALITDLLLLPSLLSLLNSDVSFAGKPNEVEV